MKTVGELARYIRSKNAGPFWITMDIFFDDDSSFEQVSNSESITPRALSGILDTP